MFRYTTITILLLTLFSCGQPVGEEVIEIETQKMDDILSMSDSLLSIADIEMDHIKEHSMDVNKRIEYLRDKNQRYERKLEENSLKLVEFIMEIDSLRTVIENKNSTIHSLNNTVKNKDLIIQLNMKTIKQNQSDFEVMSEFCETEIDKLVGTVEMLNDSIDNIMDEINEHFKEHRVDKIFDSH